MGVVRSLGRRLARVGEVVPARPLRTHDCTKSGCHIPKGMEKR